MNDGETVTMRTNDEASAGVEDGLGRALRLLALALPVEAQEGRGGRDHWDEDRWERTGRSVAEAMERAMARAEWAAEHAVAQAEWATARALQAHGAGRLGRPSSKS